MKQFIIDRYNKGQDKWNIRSFYLNNADNGDGLYYVRLYECYKPNEYQVQLYDFLFNPKWGFAQAFWKDESYYCCEDTENLVSCFYDVPSKKGETCLMQDENRPKETCSSYRKLLEDIWKYYLQQMAIAPDVLKYLEQFKDITNAS